MNEERRTRRGHQAPNALFNPEQVDEFRRRRAQENLTITQLAREAGCSYGTMQKLLSGERYRDEKRELT